MAAWTGDGDFEPFDEAGDLRDDLPSDLANFIQKFDITKSFSIEILKFENATFAGDGINVGVCEKVVPSYESLVKANGPGHYGLKTTWVPKGGRSKTQMLQISLMGSHWKKVFTDAEKERRAEALKAAEEQAQEDAIRYRHGLTPGVNPMNEFFETLGKMNGATGGGLFKTGGGGGSDLAAICAMMGQMMTGMMGMMMQNSTNQMNLLITVMGQNNGQNGPAGMREMLNIVGDTLKIRDGLLPKDKSWVEEVSSALAQNAEGLINIFKRSGEGTQPDPEYQEMREGLKKTRDRAQIDPEFLEGLVRHMDAKMPPHVTDKILKGYINVQRPKKTPGAPAPEAPQPPSAEAPKAPLGPQAA